MLSVKYFGFLSECFTEKKDDEERLNFLISNIPRYHLYINIKAIFKSEMFSESKKRQTAINTIQNSIHVLQKNYRNVIDSYNQIKKELLL